MTNFIIWILFFCIFGLPIIFTGISWFFLESEINILWKKMQNPESYEKIDSAYKQVLYYKKMGRLRFEQFLHIYNVNPTAWHLFDDDGWFIAPWREDKENHTAYAICWPSRYEFTKYRRWVKRQMAIAKKLAKTSSAKAYAAIQDENLKAIMKLVQGDIDATHEDLYKALENLKTSMEAFGMDIKEITEIKYQ